MPLDLLGALPPDPHSSALPLQTSRTITVSDTANTYTVIHKKWQYICDHNTVKSTNGNECPLQVSYLLIYFTCDVNMTSLSLMSCNSICCMCGEARSSCWLMMQLTNGQQACMLVFVPMVDILNIHCYCQFVFPVLNELCFTPRLMYWVIF